MHVDFDRSVAVSDFLRVLLGLLGYTVTLECDDSIGICGTGLIVKLWTRQP
jgi:hypothetical protein